MRRQDLVSMAWCNRGVILSLDLIGAYLQHTSHWLPAAQCYAAAWESAARVAVESTRGITA